MFVLFCKKVASRFVKAAYLEGEYIFIYAKLVFNIFQDKNSIKKLIALARRLVVYIDISLNERR